jgi:hypothetical protein
MAETFQVVLGKSIDNDFQTGNQPNVNDFPNMKSVEPAFFDSFLENYFSNYKTEAYLDRL